MSELELEVAKTKLCEAAPDLLAVCHELVDSAEYWGEYDVPIGIVDRLNAAITKAGGPALRTPDQCQWQQDKIGNWLTRCGCIFWKEHGDPSDIGMDFCPFCGRPIEAP